MTYEEYKQGMQKLKEEFDLKQLSLTRMFAFSNSPYKEGDVIKDHIGAIRIVKIKFRGEMFGQPPECVYIGRELKKDGAPTKKENFRKVFQSNIIQDEQNNH